MEIIRVYIIHDWCFVYHAKLLMLLQGEVKGSDVMASIGMQEKGI